MVAALLAEQKKRERFVLTCGEDAWRLLARSTAAGPPLSVWLASGAAGAAAAA